MFNHKIHNLNDLLIEELKDLYSAEEQMEKALPRMAKAAHDGALRQAFESHHEETIRHRERLEQVFALLNVPAKKRHCQAMEGLVAEGKEAIGEDAAPAVRDAALIVAAQKAEHYEIASYGSVRTFADLLGHLEVGRLLQATLEEEAATDKHLTTLSQSLNVRAQTEVHA
ncbi:MAG: ferritin-like domain-containing protein [Verrucomicrobia bacterium]|nr:ferritin-like domain-containing protein [Verrucomicrobiota bacterium]